MFREAEEWILEEGGDWLFSFDNICEVLRLDPHHLRQGLMRAKERWLAGSLKGKPLPHGATKKKCKEKKLRAAA